MPTNLDTGHLECVNGIRNTILEFVLNSSGAQEEHILLDYLRSLIQGLTTTVDGCGSLVIDRNPFPVFGLRDISIGDTECPKSFSSVIL